MNEQSHIPSLTGKSEIGLQKKTSYIMSCPKCEKDMDVTSVTPNTYIECKRCNNITWRPDYNPPWWAKTKNFVLSILITLFAGIITGLIGNAIYDSLKIKDIVSPNSNSLKK